MMEALDVIVIIIGLLCVAASFFISEKAGGNAKADERLEKELEERLREKLFGEENMESAVAKLVEAVIAREQEQAEELLSDVKGEMDRITNEKMMAFTELSDQVLEKIHQDHTEVVFLYDMLKEKESELKDLSAKISGVRKEAQELLVKADRLSTVSGSAPSALAVGEEKAALAAKKNAVVRKESRPKSGTQMLLERQHVSEPSAESGEGQEEKNERILELHREGRSVMEISKLLELGQGEVKLVIDLFQGAK